MGSRYFTTDGQLMQYTLPSEGPTAPGQTLAADTLTSLRWAVNAPTVVEGTPGQVAVSSSAAVYTVGLDPETVVIPGALVVGGVSFPDATGTPGQVLALASDNKAEWLTPTSSGTIAGTANQITVTTSGGVATVALATDTQIAGSLSVGAGIAAASFVQQSFEQEVAAFVNFGGTGLVLQLGGAATTAGVDMRCVSLFNQKFMSINWASMINLVGSQVVRVTAGVFFGYGASGDPDVSSIITDDIPFAALQTQWGSTVFPLLGRCAVEVWEPGYPGQSGFVGLGHVNFSLGPGSTGDAIALYITMDNAAAGMAVSGVNTFAYGFLYRFVANSSVSPIATVPSVISLQWS